MKKLGTTGRPDGRTRERHDAPCSSRRRIQPRQSRSVAFLWLAVAATGSCLAQERAGVQRAGDEKQVVAPARFAAMMTQLGDEGSRNDEKAITAFKGADIGTGDVFLYVKTKNTEHMILLSKDEQGNFQVALEAGKDEGEETHIKTVDDQTLFAVMDRLDKKQRRQQRLGTTAATQGGSSEDISCTRVNDNTLCCGWQVAKVRLVCICWDGQHWNVCFDQVF